VAKKLGVSQRELEELNPELKGKWLTKGTVVKVPKQEQRKEKGKKAIQYTKSKKEVALSMWQNAWGFPKRNWKGSIQS